MLRRLAALGIAVAALLVAQPERAAPSSDAVVVTVGGSTLTSTEIARRLARIPPFQLATYGQNPDEIRKNFVERVLVPELLYAEEAKRLKLEADAAIGDRVRELLRQALESDLRETTEAKDPVTPTEVANYFAE